MGFSMDDLGKMGITFDEEHNVIRIQEDGQEMVRIQLPEGADLEEVIEALMSQMAITSMSGEEACAQVREDIEMVNDALIDMIENNDADSNQVAVNALSAATKNIVALMSGVCENQEEEEYVANEIMKPLAGVSKTLMLASSGAREVEREQLIDIAAAWLPVRAAVEEILDEIEG